METGNQSPTLLESLLSKQKQNPRRGQQMVAEGMRATVSPMDSLSSQSMMDSAQETTVSPAAASPFRLASTSSDREDGSPFMTAQLRRSGGAPTPAQTAQCPGGRCGVPRGMNNASQYPIVTSERVIAIDGKPVNPSQPVPSGGPAMPVAQVMPDLSPEGLYQEAMSLTGQAAIDWAGGNSMAAANNSVLARNAQRAALEHAQSRRELDLLERQLTEQELNNKIERQTQEQNLKSARDHSAAGGADNVSNALRGTGDYSNKDVEARAAAAAAKTLAMLFPDGKRDPVIVKQTYDKYHQLATGHDLSYRIAGQVNRGTDGKPVYSRGNREPIDQLVNNRFFGRRVGDVVGKPQEDWGPAENTPLTGELLRNQMHKELDGPLTTQLQQRFLELSPEMNAKDAENLAADEAYKIVDDYHQQVHVLNSALASGGESYAYQVYRAMKGAFSGGGSSAPQDQEKADEPPAKQPGASRVE